MSDSALSLTLNDTILQVRCNSKNINGTTHKKMQYAIVNLGTKKIVYNIINNTFSRTSITK